MDREVNREALVFSDLSTPMWALAAVVHSASAIIHATDECEMLTRICSKVASNHRYPLATVGWARGDKERSVEIVAAGGFAIGYVDDLHITWGEGDYSRGPSGTAIRTGRHQINNNARTNPNFAPWCERALEFGLQSSLALPLRINGNVEGVLTVYSSQADAFQDPEVFILRVLAESISYGIATRRERIHYGKIFEKTISALSEALGKRDPYTAGHQKRVTDLAVAIAKELGLPAQQQMAVRLAGLVHDIGKIQVPSELLVKPSRLSPTEFELIKGHPEVGYEILKDVDFPWPIAEIVRQHHEKLDGSGYPHALSGFNILQEARILTVADIVEAMSSHRPYRAALGTEAALAEIQRMRGSQLDPGAVDACINLFREQGYAFPQI